MDLGWRAAAVVLAMSWLVFPGFGVIDLSVTWDPDWPVALEAGWGLFFSVFVGLSFLWVAVVPRRSAAAVAQLCQASGVLAAAALLSLEVVALVLAATIALEAALVALTPAEELRGRASPDPPLMIVAGVAAPPWLLYGWRMAELNRSRQPDADVTIGVDHYSVQAATAVALVVCPLLVAFGGTGRRLIGTNVAVVAVYLGLVSYAWPGTPGGLGRNWSVAAMLWGLSIAVLTWRRRSVDGPDVPSRTMLAGWFRRRGPSSSRAGAGPGRDGLRGRVLQARAAV